ncbi:enoyl-CoA hydratase/isomerase family protein [Alcaligenaceae bacterium]|nr:enoyl-CoA hydratase/isomerase family protein [Alcaligenaceae bacterium]
MENQAHGMTARHVRHTVTQGVARIVIDRPEKRNALGLQTIAELTNTFRQLDNDPAVRVIVLTGSGNRAFASGADLDELPSAFDSPESARSYDAQVASVYEAIADCAKPTIARMAGHAIGGGCLLALACDIRIAVKDIKVGFPVALIGLMLSPHEYELILRQTTVSTAKQLMFTGKRIPASEARALGLLDVVVPADIFDAAVNNMAMQIAGGAPLAIAATKSILNAMERNAGVEEAIARAYRSVYTSSDLREGLTAIRAKRKPDFTGN